MNNQQAPLGIDRNKNFAMTIVRWWVISQIDYREYDDETERIRRDIGLFRG
jgi:hypothetical protein